MLLCTAYSTFKTVYSFNSRRSWIISVLICLNPVFICQIFTSYNDMAVGTLIITAALLGMKIYAERADEVDYITLFCVTAMSCLVKFTAPLLVGLVLIAYGTGYLVKTRGKNFSMHFKKPAAVIISGFLIGTVIFGFDPYIKHLANGQNLVYPVMGEGKYDIINTNASQGLEGKPEALKYFISLASESNSNFNEHYKIKIPFSIHSREVLYLNNADIRLGGFGVWFSGALLLALACAAAACFKKHRMKAETAILLITFFALGLFFPEAWWARYASYTYYIPIFLMIYAGSSPVKNIKTASLAVAAVLLINSTLNAVCVTKSGIKEKTEIDKYLDIIKAQNKSIILRVNDFPSHVKLFEEKGIDFTLSPISLYNPVEFYKTTKFEYVD